MKKIKLSELLIKLYNNEYLSDYEYEIYIRLVQSFQKKEAQEEEAVSKYFFFRLYFNYSFHMGTNDPIHSIKIGSFFRTE